MKCKYGKNILIILALTILFLGTNRIMKAADIETEVFSVKEFTYTVTKSAVQDSTGLVNVSINEKYRASIRCVTIPQEVVYNNLVYKVDQISVSGFSNCSNLSYVSISTGVNSIQRYAFSKCANLMCVVIPRSVTSIDKEAFLDSPSSVFISCQNGSIASVFAKNNGLTCNIIAEGIGTSSSPQNKLIIVGDSRTFNMRNWVKTSVPTAFVAKSGQGYIWFVNEGVQSINAIKNPGDTILIWLGVNDYFSSYLGGNSWTIYANEINYLAKNDWKECKVCVASVGYVDYMKLGVYYGIYSRSNVMKLDSGNHISGIKEFNSLLRYSLISSVSWIDTSSIIGIKDNDIDATPDSIWLTNLNGMKDGLHYGESKTQEIYNYFVKETMSR